MKCLESWKQRARGLKIEVYALYLANRDPRVRWYAKAFTACVVGYAFSPIDLIPDPIPIVGHLDDAVLLPLGVLIARRLIPEPVLSECRERARALIEERKPVNRTAAVVIVMVWVLMAAAAIRFLIRRSRPE